MNYVGTELELFQHAKHWKRYWTSTVKFAVCGHVLDVGCGLGVNARYVCNDRITGYTFLEPDARLLARVQQYAPPTSTIAQHTIHGTTKDLKGEQFDTLLYIDVLEHLEDAVGELQRARDLLRVGGHLIIVVPAFMFLYSPFDKAVGHYRRYDRRMLREQLPTAFHPVRMHYLDSAGLLLSLGNKLLLRHSTPTAGQIAFWDTCIVPLSRITDTLTLHTFGRSLVAVLRKS